MRASGWGEASQGVVEGACGALGVSDGACDAPRVTDGAGSGSARAALVDRRAVGRRAVRCGKAGASRPYRTDSCGSYRMGGELRPDTLLGPDVRALVPPL